MLKYLKIKNFLSYKETEINFESTKYWNLKDNVFSIWKTTLMKNMLIYWANASWKSNILKAIVIIHLFTLNKTNSPIITNPFLLDDSKLKNEPSFFEIWFFVDNKEYIYNFELSDWIVISENLKEIKWKETDYLFIRNKNDIKFEWELYETFSWKVEDKVKETTSLLWILDQFNWKLNWKPMLHFFKNLWSLWGWYSPYETVNLLKLNENEKNKDFVLEFLKCADIDICDVQIKKEIRNVTQIDFVKKSSTEMIEEWYRIEIWHKKENWEIEYFNLLWWQESTWTVKLFWILWNIVTTIINEWILFIDEIENSLHPHIIKKVFELLNSDLWKKYQFILTTHNIELMNLRDFKKEQIWIVRKNKDKSSELYTLYDFEDLRSENDVQKLYNNWAFWWIPNTKDFSILFKNFL